MLAKKGLRSGPGSHLLSKNCIHNFLTPVPLVVSFVESIPSTYCRKILPKFLIFSAQKEFYKPSICMIIFRNKNKYLLDKIEARNHTVSTLLIPMELNGDFQSLLEKYQGDLSIYLRSLLKRFRIITHSGLIPEPIKVKTEYQEKDQDLIRFNFRPTNADWVELGELALAFGKSRCWLFVYLLKLDIAGMSRLLRKAKLSFGVPTLPSLELKIFWTLQRVRENFTRGYHVKV